MLSSNFRAGELRGYKRDHSVQMSKASSWYEISQDINHNRSKAHLPGDERRRFNDGRLDDLLTREHAPRYSVDSVFLGICPEIALAQ